MLPLVLLLLVKLIINMLVCLLSYFSAIRHQIIPQYSREYQLTGTCLYIDSFTYSLLYPTYIYSNYTYAYIQHKLLALNRHPPPPLSIDLVTGSMGTP